MSSTPIEVAVFGSLNMDFVVRPAGSRPGDAGRSALTNFCGRQRCQPGGGLRPDGRARRHDRLRRRGRSRRSPARRARRRRRRRDGACVRVAGSTSGVAVILVDDAAENRIVIVPGANAEVGVDDAGCGGRTACSPGPRPAARGADGRRRAGGDHRACRRASGGTEPRAGTRAAGRAVVPVDALVLNETEATLLTGDVVDDVASAMQAAVKLQGMGPATVGHAGRRWRGVCRPPRAPALPAAKVDAVDTTGGGRHVHRRHVAALVPRKLARRRRRASPFAAGLCVTRPGAQNPFHAYRTPGSAGHAGAARAR